MGARHSIERVFNEGTVVNQQRMCLTLKEVFVTDLAVVEEKFQTLNVIREHKL